MANKNIGKNDRLSFPLEFLKLCFIIEAKITTWSDVVLNVHRENI